MKKNILAIIILAATLVNVTLSAMMLFTVVPYVKKASNLITNVLQVIDLELESGAGKEEQVTLADLETTPIFKTEDKVNFSLKTGSDGKSHYAASVTASVSVNTKASDYSKKKDMIASQTDFIKDVIQTEIAKFTNDEVGANYEEVKAIIETRVLEKLQKEFDTKCVYKVTINFIVG